MLVVNYIYYYPGSTFILIPSISICRQIFSNEHIQQMPGALCHPLSSGKVLVAKHDVDLDFSATSSFSSQLAVIQDNCELWHLSRNPLSPFFFFLLSRLIFPMRASLIFQEYLYDI